MPSVESTRLRFLQLRRRSVAGQSQLEMTAHILPFRRQDAEHHGVADRAVLARGVVTEDAVALGADPFDRLLRSEIEVVGAQADDLAVQPFEGVLEEQ